MIFSRFNRSSLLLLRGVEIFGARRSTSITTIPQCVPTETYGQQRLSEIEKKFVEQNENRSFKRIPVSTEQFKNLRSLKPDQPEDPHRLKVSILGEPNVGKSTLVNCLVKWKVCAVSRKVHTTRKKSAAVLVEDNKQIVFLDTPGFVTPERSKKHSLEASFVMDPVRSIHEADLIAVVIDISNKWTNNRINEDILKILENYHDKKSILILNKVDAMKSKSRILHLTRILTGGFVAGIKCPVFETKIDQKTISVSDIVQLVSKSPKEISGDNENESFQDDSSEHRGWTSFARVFMVSALKNDGMNDLREYLLSETLPGNWTYHNSTVTDQHPHDIALMTVREKLLEYLPEEIPYLLDLRISKWELLSTGCPKIDIKIVCSNSRHKRFVIGPGGRHIATCVEKSRLAMREAFRKDVVLHIAVV